MLFVQNACQYYATARFAMHAQCMPVCGNLFHHAVEMLLKGGLARKRKLSELRDMKHKLKELWRAFKADFPDPILKRHDKTISSLHKFEVIRYPDAILKYGMGATAQWSGPAAKVTTYGEIKTPKQYAIVVSDIDELVADVFKISSWNPDVFMGRSRRHHPSQRPLGIPDQTVLIRQAWDRPAMSKSSLLGPLRKRRRLAGARKRNPNVGMFRFAWPGQSTDQVRGGP